MDIMTDFFKISERYTKEIFDCFSSEDKETNSQPASTNPVSPADSNSHLLQEEKDANESVQSDSLCTKMFHVCTGTFHVTIGNTVTGLYNAIEDVVLLVTYLVAALLYLIAAPFAEGYAEGSLAYLELAGEAICFFVRDVLRAIPFVGHVIARAIDLFAVSVIIETSYVGAARMFRFEYDPSLCIDRYNIDAFCGEILRLEDQDLYTLT